jgi:TolB-like protein/Tfp pilus assembly protein PilF
MAERGYQFGPFTFDSKRKLLLKRGSPVAVGQRCLVLLETLLAAEGRAVSKADLMDAAWQTVNIEESNLSVQIAALRKCLGKSGSGEEWIATVQRVGYQFVNPGGADKTPLNKDPDAKAQLSGDKPSIAVLPFVNMSGDPEQEYFADGMVEEIITALSRFSALFVIARNSSFAYKGRNVDVKQVGHELGVRYILEGSVRKVASRVRIAVQLIDAGTGVHLWADRFDGELEDVFDLQDRVTASVVGAIAPKLEKAEIERSRRKPTESLDAYDYYLRGVAALHLWTREGNDEALAHLNQAVTLDPNFATAHGVAARCYVQRKVGRWVDNYARVNAEAERLARRAVALGPDDAVALCMAGFALVDMAMDFDGADAVIERALALNPNLAMAWLCSGWSKISLGQSEAAIASVEHALRLSPQDPQVFSMQNALACAHFVAGHYAEAFSMAGMALRDGPNFTLPNCVAATSAALLGRMDESHKAMARVRNIAPDLSISNVKEVLAFQRQEDTDRWTEGLRKAGLPE